MNEAMDDDLDALLREHLDGPVPDDGFCDHVMDRLPARRRSHGWPMAAGTFAGMAMCWLSLRSSPIADTGWRDWLVGQMSASAIMLLVSMTGMALLALVWAIAEADERNRQPHRA